MGNTCACVRRLKKEPSSTMSGSRGGEDVVAGITSAGGDVPRSSSRDLHLPAPGSVGSDVVANTSSSDVVSVEVERRIEQSKSHWSEVREFDSGSGGEEDVEADNRGVFKALLFHPTWGAAFFHTFGYDIDGCKSFGSLEIGEKFAAGGQAELFHAKVVWRQPEDNEWDQEHGREWVLKVFRKGTPLRHLQKQWPHGMLQFAVEESEKWQSPSPKVYPRFHGEVQCGTLLEDGRFAFLMGKEHLDLRTFIDRNMLTSSNKHCGLISKNVQEEMMFEVALGMSWLHSRDIVHRDLKASNVLVNVHDNGKVQCFVADYECSIGVVGTGFFRAPEILKACQDMSVSKRPELFTKSSDVYSYGMTCYEILTGRLPFDGHLVKDYADCVINGVCPKVPKYVDVWMERLLRECWQFDPLARPSFEDVVNSLLDNSARIRKLVSDGWYEVDKIDWINWGSLVHKFDVTC